MSAEQNLKTVKLASTKYYDGLPTEEDLNGSNPDGQGELSQMFWIP